MKIGIIVQARMGSTRLPGKILKNFYLDKTLIEVLIENLEKVGADSVIIATSESAKDDELVKFLKDKGKKLFRGSETDVLARFIQAAQNNDIDGIIRICSDNPFIDVGGIRQLIEKAKTCKADYIGFRINDKPSILTHFGFWAEFVRLSALKRVAASTDSSDPAHEHVTYHIYKHPDEFKCEWIDAPEFLQGREDIRLTIDTPDDLKNARIVFSALKELSDDFALEDVVRFLDIHNDIKQSMISNIRTNRK